MDVMKEFQIRVKDGSKATGEAMAQMSKSTQKVWKDFLNGKGTVKDVHNTVIKELKGMDDQVKANNIGVGLYGTKFEDLEADAMYALGNIDGAIGDITGSMENMIKAQNKSFGKQFTRLIRNVQAAFLPVGEILLKMAEDIFPLIEKSVQKLTAWFQKLNPNVQQLIVAFGLFAAALPPILVAIGALGLALSGLSLPFILITATVLGFATFLATQFGNIQKMASGFVENINFDELNKKFEGIKKSFDGVKDAITQFFSKNKTVIKQGFSDLFEGATSLIVPMFERLIETVKILAPLFVQAFAQMGSALKNVGSFLAPFIDQFNNTFLTTLEKITSNLAPIGKMILTTLKPAFDFLVSVGKSVGDTIAHITDKFGEMFAIKKTVEAVGTVIKNVFSIMGSIFKDVFTGLTNFWNQNGEKIFLAIYDTVLKLVRMIGNISSSVKNLYTAMQPTLQAIGNLILSVISSVVDFWSTHGMSILNTIQTVVQTLFQILINLWTQLQPLILQVVQFVQECISQLRTFWDENGTQILEAVTNVFNGIKAVIDFVMPAVMFIIKLVWESIKNIISGALDVIMGVVKIFTGLFTGDWKKMWEGIKQTLSGAIKLVIELFKFKFIGDMLGKLGGFVKEFAQKMWNGLKTGFDNVVHWMKNIYDKIVETFLNILKKPVQWGKDLINFLVSGISSVIGKVTTKATEIFDAFKNMLSFSKLKDIGKDVILGIKKGIEGAWNKLKEAVDWIGQLIPNWLKKALGIHSPSRVMASVAKWIPEGIAKGIVDNTKNIEQSMAGLKDMITDPIENIDPNLKTFDVTGNVAMNKASLSNLSTSIPFQAIQDNLVRAEVGLKESPQNKTAVYVTIVGKDLEQTGLIEKVETKITGNLNNKIGGRLV